MNDNQKIDITIILLALALALAVMLYVSAGASASGGCVAQPAYMAADAAGQTVRYHQPGQLRLINNAIATAYTYGAPERWTRHLLIAKRYWLSGHTQLAKYHLFTASKRPCW